MIKIRHKGAEIECETVEEAAELLKRLLAEEQKTIIRKTTETGLAHLFDLDGGKPEISCWTRETFWKFIESLGEPQTSILEALAERKGKVSDEELREICEVQSNQQLAGILSGISKQASAVNVPARSVYSIETELKASGYCKFYSIAPDFLNMAKEMNWPAG